MRKKRLWMGLALFLSWALLMAMLAERHWGGRRVPAGNISAGLQAPSTTWMGIFLGDGTRVGHVHLRRHPEARDETPGQRFTMDVQMALMLLGRATDLNLSGVLWRANDVPLATLDLEVQSVDQTLSLDGELRDGQLVGNIRSGGETLPLNMALPPDFLLAGDLGASLNLPDLEAGDDVRMPSFDPLTLQSGTARLRCVARETLQVAGLAVEARRVEVETSGFTSVAWVDDAGELLRAETPFGLTLERITPAQLVSNKVSTELSDDSANDLLAATAVVPTGPRPMRGAQLLVARVAGVTRPLPADGIQGFSEGELRIDIRREHAKDALSTSDQQKLLRADAFVQSDHPRLQKLSESITANHEDDVERALALYRWVYDNLEKTPVMSLPSALEVLESRRGDCNEHTVLYTALARAAGLPTRIAIGLVWSDDLDGFYYHAWPEVHANGAFMRLDPTLGQPIADATHIKLLEGGIESWPRLLPYLGTLELDIIEVQ